MSDRAGLPATAPEALREVVGDDPTPELAAALAMNPAVVAVLLAEHVADPAGRCTACRSQVTGPIAWPCAIAVAAAAARRLIADRTSVECPRCHRRSHHPTDVAEGYCGHCHTWTSPSRA